MTSIAIAKKMMAMGLDDDTVMQATGISASDITELRTKQPRLRLRFVDTSNYSQPYKSRKTTKKRHYHKKTPQNA